MSNRNRKACAYCGRETNSTTDQCANCGSTSFETLEQAVLHQDQHRKFNEQRQGGSTGSANTARTATNVKKKSNSGKIIAVVAVVVVIFIAIGIIIAKAIGGKDNSTHRIGNTITTDWFQMHVYEGKIVRSKNSYGGLNAPANNHERVMVDIKLYNHLSNEALDINIDEDFYLESSNGTKYTSLNTGGSYLIYDKLSHDGMFYGKFMVSPRQELHGYIAFDIPRTLSKVSFVYKEYNYEGDTRTTVKHYYKVNLEYEMPVFPATDAQNFYNKAYDAGYVIEIINDYDGHETFWVGAYKYLDESATKGLVKKPEPLYWIDCTRDTSVGNAAVEFNRYVAKVKNVGGVEDSYSSTSYKYQINTSSTKFGFAYQIGLYNYLVETAPIEYKEEILAFMDKLELSLSKT